MKYFCVVLCINVGLSLKISNREAVVFNTNQFQFHSRVMSDEKPQDVRPTTNLLDDFVDPREYFGKQLSFALFVSIVVVVLSSNWRNLHISKPPHSISDNILPARGSASPASKLCLTVFILVHFYILSIGNPISLIKPRVKASRTFQNNTEFSWDEIALHNQPGDVWLVIDNLVYDVSDFGEVHSGGSMIYQGAGVDATTYFHQSHPYSKVPKVRRVMSTLQIGSLKSRDSLMMVNDAFQIEFSRQLDEKLKDAPRRPLGPKILTHIKLAAYIGSFYLAFVHGSIVGAIVLRLTSTTFHGVVHGCSHAMIFEPKGDYLHRFQRIVGSFLQGAAYAYDAPHFPAYRLYGFDVLQDSISDQFKYGAPVDDHSSWGSATIHFGHHTYTGEPARDPDIRILREPFWWLFTRNNENRPLRWYHSYQHLYKYPVDVMGELLIPFDYFARPRAILITGSKIAQSGDFTHTQKTVELYRLAHSVVFGSPHQDGVFLPLIGGVFLHPMQLFKVLFIPILIDCWSLNNIKWGTSLMHYAHKPREANAETPISIKNFDNSADVHYFTTCTDSWLAPLEGMMRYSDNGYHYQGIHHAAPTLSPAYYGLAAGILSDLSLKFNVTYHRFDWITASLNRIKLLQEWGSVLQS